MDRLMPTLQIEVGEIDYDRETSLGLRQAVIEIRDAAMLQMPEAASVVVTLTHVIGWMHTAIEQGLPEGSASDVPEVHPDRQR